MYFTVNTNRIITQTVLVGAASNTIHNEVVLQYNWVCFTGEACPSRPSYIASLWCKTRSNSTTIIPQGPKNIPPPPPPLSFFLHTTLRQRWRWGVCSISLIHNPTVPHDVTLEVDTDHNDSSDFLEEQLCWTCTMGYWRHLLCWY